MYEVQVIIELSQVAHLFTVVINSPSNQSIIWKIRLIRLIDY
jgi:hypothetical protein